MEKRILVVNVGSSSQKYAFFEGEKCRFFAHYETFGDGFRLGIERHDESGLVLGEKDVKKISKYDFLNSSKKIVDLLKEESLIKEAKDIDVMGFRVVHGGTDFFAPAIIDKKLLSRLEEIKELAPLHLDPVIIEIKEFAKFFPDVKKIAFFDTEFHQNLPIESQIYALPAKIQKDLHIRRIGFHGISCQSLVEKLKKDYMLPEKLIICHLGSGSSITAVKNGKSFDTSMGLTPLEGLVMGTRSGDIDPGVIIYLQEKLKLSPRKMDEILNKESGLLGISDKTSDVRELLSLESQGDAQASLALSVFAYRVKKYIGAYAAAMGGVDGIIFSAAIGEGSPLMRERFCQGLEFLGVSLDKNKNYSTVDKDGSINADQSKVKIFVLKTDEMKFIAEKLVKMNL